MHPKSSIVACDAGVLGEAIFTMAGLVAPAFRRAFTSNSKPNLGQILPEIHLELCALYLDALNRDMFLEVGEGPARNRFADSLFGAVSRQVQQNLGVVPGEFGGFCNERQIEFSQYKELIGPPGNLGGTLFWEFGKSLAFRYEAFNPIAIQAFILATTDGYIGLREIVDEIANL